jgi:hypothetical protein
LSVPHLLPSSDSNSSCIEIRCHCGVILDYKVSDGKEVVTERILRRFFTVKGLAEGIIVAVMRQKRVKQSHSVGSVVAPDTEEYPEPLVNGGVVPPFPYTLSVSPTLGSAWPVCRVA